jgi:hypothetical protein
MYLLKVEFYTIKRAHAGFSSVSVPVSVFRGDYSFKKSNPFLTGHNFIFLGFYSWNIAHFSSKKAISNTLSSLGKQHQDSPLKPALGSLESVLGSGLNSGSNVIDNVHSELGFVDSLNSVPNPSPVVHHHLESNSRIDISLPGRDEMSSGIMASESAGKIMQEYLDGRVGLYEISRSGVGNLSQILNPYGDVLPNVPGLLNRIPNTTMPLNPITTSDFREIFNVQFNSIYQSFADASKQMKHCNNPKIVSDFETKSKALKDSMSLVKNKMLDMESLVSCGTLTCPIEKELYCISILKNVITTSREAAELNEFVEGLLLLPEEVLNVNSPLTPEDAANTFTQIIVGSCTGNFSAATSAGALAAGIAKTAKNINSLDFRVTLKTISVAKIFTLFGGSLGLLALLDKFIEDHFGKKLTEALYVTSANTGSDGTPINIFEHLGAAMDVLEASLELKKEKLLKERIDNASKHAENLLKESEEDSLSSNGNTNTSGDSGTVNTALDSAVSPAPQLDISNAAVPLPAQLDIFNAAVAPAPQLDIFNAAVAPAPQLDIFNAAVPLPAQNISDLSNTTMSEI